MNRKSKKNDFFTNTFQCEVVNMCVLLSRPHLSCTCVKPLQSITSLSPLSEHLPSEILTTLSFRTLVPIDQSWKWCNTYLPSLF